MCVGVGDRKEDLVLDPISNAQNERYPTRERVQERTRNGLCDI